LAGAQEDEPRPDHSGWARFVEELPTDSHSYPTQFVVPEEETLGPDVVGNSTSLNDSRTSGLSFVGPEYSEVNSSDSEKDPTDAARKKTRKKKDADSTVKQQKALINRLYVRMSRQKKKTAKLEVENAELKFRLYSFGDDLLNELKEIKEGAAQNDLFSAFMMDQLKNRSVKGACAYRWSSLFTKHCIAFRAKHTAAYEYIRKSGLMVLPTWGTLKRFSDPSTGQVSSEEPVIEQ